MAYDKVIDSSVLDAGLTAIADAIRAKAGTSDALAFPTAMAEAIAAIEAGGGGGVQIITGTVTNAEDSVLNIEHNAGKIPSIVLIYREDLTDQETVFRYELYACMAVNENPLNAVAASKIVACSTAGTDTTCDSTSASSKYNFGRTNISTGNIFRDGEGSLSGGHLFSSFYVNRKYLSFKTVSSGSAAGSFATGKTYRWVVVA